ncbi:MAG: HEAT repeat domain-containing protein [Planctomycetota bacterium]|nr:HEAT repeat domain-containing protein [Planctomycetota bacterium]MDA1105737.1 HEAT repeat domain-containing protein [Planctomycetota bacterium]
MRSMGPATRTRWARCVRGVLAFGVLAGCDTITSDFQWLGQQISPPSPGEAATWAVDPTNPTLQREGLALIGDASFGGEEQYLKLYRVYVEESIDPLVKSAAILALARYGTTDDAFMIAKQLRSPNAQVRLAAAKGLQRIYQPKVEADLWRSLLLAEEEDSNIRVELALALGQYRSDAAFQALVAALDQPELSVNRAAEWSLWVMTAQSHGLNRPEWLRWYEATPVASRFTPPTDYLFLTYQRPFGWLASINPFGRRVWERPGLPTGLSDPGQRSTDDLRGASSPEPSSPSPPASSAPTVR